MKRKILSKLLTLSLISIMTLSLFGCGNETKESTIVTKEDTVNGNQVTLIEENIVEEVSTEQVSKYGLVGITVKDFENKFANSNFFIYIENFDGSNVDLSKSLTWAFEEKNVSILNENYIIDFATLNKEEQESLLYYFVPGTIYSVKNGDIDAFKEIPEDTSENFEDDYNKLLQSWLYSKMIGVDYHGLDTIEYEEILSKIEEKETFMVYVGRDSCKYCKIFTPLMIDVLNESSINTPVYYFFTQEYKNGINEEIQGTQEQWDAIKSRLGIEYTPSFILYVNGEPIYYDSFLEDSYLKATEEEKIIIENETKEKFNSFLLENEVSITESNTQEESCSDCED